MGFVRVALASLLVLVGGAAIAAAQAGADARPLPADRFLQGAYSVATLQLEAARLVAGREPRESVKAYAGRAVSLREEMLSAIDAAAKRRNIALKSPLSAEQQAIVANLAPLDFLALSRRYLELQIEVLAQEQRVYRAQAATDDAELRAYASAWLPRIQEQAAAAEEIYQPIRP